MRGRVPGPVDGRRARFTNSLGPRVAAPGVVLPCELVKVLSVVWAILRGLLWALADDLDARRKEKAAGEQKKERPWWEAEPKATDRQSEPAAGPAGPPSSAGPSGSPERPSAPDWWGEPAPPTSPPTITVETDTGTFIASTSFSGEHMLGVRRVERPRKEGESRRRRRTSSPAAEKPETPVPPVTCTEVALRPCEPEIPGSAQSSVSEDRPSSPGIAEVAVRSQEPASPVAAALEVAKSSRNGRESGLVDPSEAPRVARARRVRGRLAPAGEQAIPLVATTLATRLALADSVRGIPPALSVARP